ncbi:MAG: PAS domain S-box protein [Melioribacteraceae bacterium]|nr:PAS domain S-box protein [Melioribacteraceae bacterium]
MPKKGFYFILNISAVLVIAFLYYQFVAKPTYNELKEKHLSEYFRQMEIKKIMIDNLISGYLESGRSISSRSVIRDKILEYKNGEVNFNTLKKFTEPKYLDGINALNDCIYAARITEGSTLVEFGVAPTYQTVRNFDSFDKIGSKISLKDSAFITEVISPIYQDNVSLGYDYLIFKDTETIKKIIDNSTELRLLDRKSGSYLRSYIISENVSVYLESIVKDNMYEFSRPTGIVFSELYNFEENQFIVLTLMSVAIFVILLFVQLRTRLIFSTQNKYLQALVEQKTDELQKALSDLKKANERIKVEKEKYKTVAENSGDFIYWIDPNGNFVYVSPNAEQITGYTTQDFLTNPDLYKEIIFPEDIQVFERHLKDKDELDGTKPIEFRIIRKDGKISWLLHLCKSVYSEDNTYLGIRGSNSDITQKKLTELELEKNREELKKSNMTKDKLFSIISHDLKNPFQSLLGITEAIANMPEEFTLDEIREVGNQLNTSSKNIFTLLDNLLKWSMMQQGNLELNPGKNSLDGLVADAVNHIEVKAELKEITVNNNLTEDIQVFCDKTMIASVLLNLLTNAVKFTNRKGTISIDAEAVDDKFIRVSIADTGIGMTDEVQSRLFRVGEKIGTPGTEGELSTGLGLLLSAEFVKENKGEIWVESKLGCGSTFFFTLPAYKSA